MPFLAPGQSLIERRERQYCDNAGSFHSRCPNQRAAKRQAKRILRELAQILQSYLYNPRTSN
jgi:hypothetical protein